jgi:hypothetical protein
MHLTDLAGFCGGFSLCGYRQDDGTIKPVINHTNSNIEDWPEELTFGFATYTLENVVKNENGFEEAQYV